MIQLASESKVEVQLRHKKDGSPFFLIRLYSLARKGLISQGAVEPKEGNVHLRVMTTAGALAEYQCNTFHDQHDPDECASAAGKAFAELLGRG